MLSKQNFTNKFLRNIQRKYVNIYSVVFLLLMEWCERGDELSRDILEWLGNNKESKLVEEASEMVDGLDTIWDKEGRDIIDEKMLEDAVEIMTAIVIGWYSDKGMVLMVAEVDLRV